MKYRCKLFFDDGSIIEKDLPEEVIDEQMNRPKSKRINTCGVDFSQVEKIEVQ